VCPAAVSLVPREHRQGYPRVRMLQESRIWLHCFFFVEEEGYVLCAANAMIYLCALNSPGIRASEILIEP
jgi:hypothetical protein